MKKQKVLVLFAIALLLGVVVGGVQTVAAAMDVTTYTDNITQPIDVSKIRFVGNPVDGQWTKGTKFAGKSMEIMYWQKGTKYLIDIHLNDSGYISGNVSFRRWGNGIAEIPDALASQSLAQLPVTTPELITRAVYKRMINENGSVDTSKIQYVGNARHNAWVIGSKPKATNAVGSGGPSTGAIGAPIAHGNTLIYWNKYTKCVIILKLDSQGYVSFVDFGLNGSHNVKTISPSLANETISKLFP